MLNKLTFYAFLLLVFSLGFMQPNFFIFGQRIPFTDLVFLLTFALWFLALICRQTKLRTDKFYLVLLFYLLAMLVSTGYSVDVGTSSIKFAGIIYLSVLAFLTFNLVENFTQLKKVVLAWLAGTFSAVSVAYLTIYLFYFVPEHWLLGYTQFHYGAVPVGNYPRVGSTFISASMFCNYLSVSLVLLFVAEKFRWLNTYLFHLLYFSILLAAIFTISAGIGGFALILGFWFWFLFRHKKPFLAGFSLWSGLILSGILFVLNFISLQNYPFSNSSRTISRLGLTFAPSSRLLVWSDSLRTFFDNFWFGRGPGQNACEVLFQNSEGTYSLLTDAHNIFLNMAAQTGVLGLFSILLIIYFLIRKVWPFESADPSLTLTRFGLGLAFCSAFLYQGLTGSFEDARHLWVLIGLMLSFGNGNDFSNSR